jgi:four helix bundle protein
MSENPLYKDNLIVKLTFDFSLEIIDFTENLTNAKKYNLANQLFRSATSIGANTKEAQNAESKADFIHKFKIAAKEVDETEYWLLLCKHSKHYPDSDELLEKLTVISKVINKIIGTSKK